MRDACESCLIVGRPGSGKSSGPMKAIVAASCRKGLGLVILCAKPREADEHAATAARYGRDVIRVGPGTGVTLNLLDELVNPAADPATNATTLARAVRTLNQVIRRSKPGGGGEHGSFFEGGEDRWTEIGFELQLLAGERPNAQALLQFLTSLPADAEQVKSEAWQDGTCGRLMKAAWAGARAAGKDDDYRRLHDAVYLEWPSIHQKTSSAFVAGIAATVNALSKGVVAAVLGATAPTLKLAEALSRTPVILVDFDYGTHGDVGRIVNTMVKHVAQVALMRRAVGPDTLLILVIADECQNVIAESDWHFASESRGYRAGTVYATQAYSSLLSAYPGDAGKAAVETLVACLNTKIAAQPDYQTSVWITGMLGKELRPFFGGSGGAGGYETPSDLVFGTTSTASSSFQMQLTELLRPEELLKLRTGGPKNDFSVDCLFFQGGRNFAGSPYTFVTFDQRAT